MGLKVSICEFFKDLISKESSEMQKNFQQTILTEVVSQFLDFLAEDDFPKRSKVTIISQEEPPATTNTVPPLADSPMKDGQAEEEHKAEATEAQRTQFTKHLSYSRILIL